MHVPHVVIPVPPHGHGIGLDTRPFVRTLLVKEEPMTTIYDMTHLAALAASYGITLESLLESMAIYEAIVANETPETYHDGGAS